MSVIWTNEGRPTRMQRRFQVRTWRRGNKYASGPYTYHRTRLVASVVADWFALLGYKVELWDMWSEREPDE